MEAVVIEPVRRLCRGCEIDARVLQRRLLREIGEVGDMRMSLRIPQLGDTAVGRDHAVEMLCEADGRLAAAGRTVERDFMARRQRREIVEQLGGVIRTVARIRARVPGEMILESHVNYSRKPSRNASIPRTLSCSSSCGA